MLASYAVILRRSALATAPVAAAMIVLSGIAGGGTGLIGAVRGVGLVIVYTTAQAVIAARLKMPYVEPHEQQIKVPHVEPDGKR